MKFTRTETSDVVICEPPILGDGRACLKETYSKDKLIKFLDFKIEYWQRNESKSSYGLLCGVLYQLKFPFCDEVLKRCFYKINNIMVF